MNAKNMLLILSLTFICTQNMEAMHIIKAMKPLSRMHYVRSISDKPKTNVGEILLIAWIFGGITTLCVQTIMNNYAARCKTGRF